jgi:hypothetical protein
MGEREKLELALEDLQEHLYTLSNIKSEAWIYHPSNPDFINPIRLYENLKEDIANIERKIEEIRWRLNSLN